MRRERRRMRFVCSLALQFFETVSIDENPNSSDRSRMARVLGQRGRGSEGKREESGDRGIRGRELEMRSKRRQRRKNGRIRSGRGRIRRGWRRLPRRDAENRQPLQGLFHRSKGVSVVGLAGQSNKCWTVWSSSEPFWQRFLVENRAI